LKVGRWGAGLYPRWSDFAPDGPSLDQVRSRRPLQRAQRRGSRLPLGCGARRGGTPLSFGLQFRGDPFGRGLFSHRALGRGLLCHRALGCESLGCGALGRGALGRGALGGALSRHALGARALGFGAPQRGQLFGVRALCRGALRRRLLGGRAAFLLRTPLLRGVTLLDRALHGRALLGGATVFLGASLLRQAPLFLGPPFVLGAALRGRTLLRGATFRCGALFFNTALGRCPLGRGSLRGGPLGCGALLLRALLFLSAPLHGGESFLDRTLHRRVLGGRALFLFGATLQCCALLGAATLGSDALLFGTTLHCRLLGRGALGRGALGRGPFLRRALLFLSAPLHGGESFLDRAFQRGVLGCGPLLLVGPTLLREASSLRGALGSSAILGRTELLELAGFGGGSTLLRGVLSRRMLLRSTAFFLSAPRFRDAPIFGGTLFGRAKLRGDTLLFGTTRFLRRAPLFGTTRFLRDTFLFGALLGDTTLFLSTTRFLRRAPLLGGAHLRGLTLFLEASRFVDSALLFCSALRRDPLIFCSAFRRDPHIFCGALRRDAFIICAPPVGGFVHRGEDLFVLEGREDLVIFELARFLGRRLFIFERREHERSIFPLERGGDRLVHGRPRLFDARCGGRRAFERSRGRATVFIDELFEQTAKSVGRGGPQIGWRRIA
jgi:hypothetical protein